MPAYLIELLEKGGQTKIVNQVVVMAPDAATARAICKALYSADGGTVVWDDATVTALTDPDNWEGYTFNVHLVDNNTPFTILNVNYVGLAAATLDDIGAGLAVALNATAIDGAAYDAATNTLTIVETTDDRGDWVITVAMTPPATAIAGTAEALATASGCFNSLTAAGAHGIARTVVLSGGSPKVFGKGLKVS